MSDAPKIVAIHNGRPLPEPGKPNDACVRELEKLLDQARAGEVVGLAGGILYADRAAGFCLIGDCGGYSQLGALEVVRKRLLGIVDP